ncbi:MAG: metalloregulator ArsR/SmtB family transcription factor [Candidatus Thermoplasmatota archaeon]
MGNECDVFKALSSETRIKILKKLIDKEIHLSGLAREIGLSKPVISRHLKILEKNNLVSRKKYGRTHVFKIKKRNFEEILNPYTQEHTVSTDKKKNLFNILEKIPGIETKEVGKHRYITSINGEKGYYIYKVDGKMPDESIEEYTVESGDSVSLEKIVSVKKKEIRIKSRSKSRNKD